VGSRAGTDVLEKIPFAPTGNRDSDRVVHSFCILRWKQIAQA